MYSLRKRLIWFLTAFFLPVMISAVFFAAYSAVTMLTGKVDEGIVFYARYLSNPLEYVQTYFGGMWEMLGKHFSISRAPTVIYLCGIAATLAWFLKPCKATAALMVWAFLSTPPFSVLALIFVITIV